MTIIQLDYVYDTVGNSCWTVKKLITDKNEKGIISFKNSSYFVVMTMIMILNKIFGKF